MNALKLLGAAAGLLAGLPFAVGQNDTLLPLAYTPLDLGEITALPGSWLDNVLQMHADGQAGHLMEFLNYVNDSTWIGGSSEYSDLDEASPYWFNAIVPLAFQTQNQRLLSEVSYYLDYVLAHQQADGWLGPEPPGADNRFLWARMMLFFGLVQYAEASPSDTERIVDAMWNYTVLEHAMLENNTGLQDGWGQVRVQESAYTIQWLLDKHPNANDSMNQLAFDTMGLLREQGADWNWFFSDGVFPTTAATNLTLQTHGVNIAEAVKEPAVFWRYEKNDSDISEAKTRVQKLFTYHGRPSGIFGADEHLAGLDPSRGSETCQVVELMFSLAYLYQAFGDNDYADMTEKAAYNGLPGSNLPDWWSHQYLQDLNQPLARNFTPNPYYADGSYSSIFGLEPNYPCCTVNHGQGYPKFLSHSFLLQNGTSLVHALLGPAVVTTTLPSSNNSVHVEASTTYPFSGTIDYAFAAGFAFDFYVRVPGWSTNVTGNASDPSTQSSISLNGGASEALSYDASTMLQKIAVPAGNSSASITFAMEPQVVQLANGSVTVNRGPLNYALGITYDDIPLPVQGSGEEPNVTAVALFPQQKDHMLNATSVWSVAIDPSTLQLVDNSANYTATSLPNPVYDYPSPPVSFTVQACNITWPAIPAPAGQAPPPPVSPVNCTSDKFSATLTPYGAAHLRMGQLPVMAT